MAATRGAKRIIDKNEAARDQRQCRGGAFR